MRIENIFNPDYRDFTPFSVNCTLVDIEFMQNKSFSKNILQGIRLRVGKIFHNPYRPLNIGPLKKVFYKHLSPGRLRSHKLFGKDFYFISPTELMHGLHEIFIDQVYKQTLPPQPYIIDCGANIGLSVIYLKQLSPNAEIVAFEPDEDNFKLLQKNIESFGFQNVLALKEAVWTENTTLQFANEGSMSSHIGSGSSEHSTQVKAIRLKDYLTRKVDFLKIDIEGAEFDVIRDSVDELHLVNNLFLEYHGSFIQNSELNQILIWLVEKGFSYYIKEAISVYENPFVRLSKEGVHYDVQLNIFCFRT